MIHHLGVFASDFEASRAFYAAALRPLAVSAYCAFVSDPDGNNIEAVHKET